MIRKLFVYLILIMATLLFLDHKSSEANQQAHGFWGFGVQLGFLELGTNQGLKKSFLLKSLDYARSLAIQSGCIPTDEIDGFIKRMQRTNNTRSLYPDITAYRQRMANYVRDNCNCSDKSSTIPFNVTGLYSQVGAGGTLKLNHSGNSVNGTYNDGNSTMEGNLSGNVLRGTFRYSKTVHGEFELIFSDDGNSFDGWWRNIVPKEKTGSWTGNRVE